MGSSGVWFESKKSSLRVRGSVSNRPERARRFSLNRINQMSRWILHVLSQRSVHDAVFAKHVPGHHCDIRLLDLSVMELA